MRRIIAETAALLLMMCMASVSAAAQIPAGIVIRDQRMTGCVTACFDAGSPNECQEEILVDCSFPQGEYTGEILTLRSRNVSRDNVRRALRAAGQSGDGEVYINSDGVRYVHTEPIDPFAGVTREAAQKQAVEIGRMYFEALGLEVVKSPSHVERPYDYEAFIEQKRTQLNHQYSDVAVMLDRAAAQWKRTRKYETREAAYTRVDFDIMVDGMRLWGNPSYPAGYADEPDAWYGFDVSASVLVSDSGVLVEAWASCIPEIAGRRQPEEGELEQYAALLDAYRTAPLVLAESWEEALELALSGERRTAGLAANHEDRPYRNQDIAEAITAYGSRSVITDIYPCLTTVSESEWAMFWHIETRQEFSDGWRY